MEALDPAKLVKSFDGWTLALLAIVAALGVLGGLARGAPVAGETTAAATTGGAKPPGRKYDWLVVGPVGALVLLLVMVPADFVRLVAQSLLGGYAGRTILDGLDARLKAALEKIRADDNAEKVGKAAEVANEALGLAEGGAKGFQAPGAHARIAELRGKVESIAASTR